MSPDLVHLVAEGGVVIGFIVISNVIQEIRHNKTTGGK